MARGWNVTYRIGRLGQLPRECGLSNLQENSPEDFGLSRRICRKHKRLTGGACRIRESSANGEVVRPTSYNRKSRANQKLASRRSFSIAFVIQWWWSIIS